MNGKAVKGYLSSLITSLDAGEVPARPATPWWVRKVAVPAALGLTMSVTGCVGDEEEAPSMNKDEVVQGKADGSDDLICNFFGADPGCDICDAAGWYGDGECDEFCDLEDTLDCRMVMMYGVQPMVETDCGDEYDNDGDGDIDCADADCIDECVAMYGVLTDEDCDDGIDNDGDGDVDCADADCIDECVLMYGVLVGETDCADDIDNDDDGLTDCADPDCRDMCVAMYGVLVGESDCTDGVDNDGDDLIDCFDTDDCSMDPACQPTARYMAPMPEFCDNEWDDDMDGDMDCDDADCADDPACAATARYMAPMP